LETPLSLSSRSSISVSDIAPAAGGDGQAESAPPPAAPVGAPAPPGTPAVPVALPATPDGALPPAPLAGPPPAAGAVPAPFAAPAACGEAPPLPAWGAGSSFGSGGIEASALQASTEVTAMAHSNLLEAAAFMKPSYTSAIALLSKTGTSSANRSLWRGAAK
jgi:hypothetical protein